MSRGGVLMSPINSYVPPDIILIDSLVFSNNYELLYPKEKLPASNNPGHAIVMLAAAAFEGIIEHRTANNSFHIQSNLAASLKRWIAVRRYN